MAVVLIASDDNSTINTLHQAFIQEGYGVVTVDNFDRLVSEIIAFSPDLIVLDAAQQMSRADAFSRKIRRLPNCVDTSLLVIISRSKSAKTVAILDSGADDVVHKPFAVGEVLARSRALLRWKKESEETLPAQLVLDEATYSVSLNERRIELSPVAYELLDFLCKNQTQYFTPDDLLRLIWNYPPDIGDTALVRNHIHNLRLKLEDDPDHPTILLSHYGRGYVIRAAVQYTKAQLAEV